MPAWLGVASGLIAIKFWPAFWHGFVQGWNQGWGHAFDDQAGEIGRPKRFWRLTEKGHGRFPDTHGDLTVNLIWS
jgi:predicted ArsR family transcriptional regulator